MRKITKSIFGSVILFTTSLLNHNQSTAKSANLDYLDKESSLDNLKTNGRQVYHNVLSFKKNGDQRLIASHRSHSSHRSHRSSRSGSYTVPSTSPRRSSIYSSPSTNSYSSNLSSVPALKLGDRKLKCTPLNYMKGDDVDSLVQLLIEKGYSPNMERIKKDGNKYYFDEEVEMAVKAFQAYNSLSVTGIVDESTIKELKK